MGASSPLGRCAMCAFVYMDDCLVHLPTMEQQVLNVTEVLDIFRRLQLYAKRSKRAASSGGRLGFLGHQLSAKGVSDLLKVQSIVMTLQAVKASD